MAADQAIEDQYLNDLIYIGNKAHDFGLSDVLCITKGQYTKRKDELESQRLPWLNQAKVMAAYSYVELGADFALLI